MAQENEQDKKQPDQTGDIDASEAPETLDPSQVDPAGDGAFCYWLAVPGLLAAG